MNIRDLRVGNYIHLMLNHLDYEIIELDVNDLKDINNQNGVYEPIILTDEWVLNFGLKPSSLLGFDGGFVFPDNHRYFLQKAQNGYLLVLQLPNGGEMIKGIEYVHELQNIWYFLTKCELIKLH